MGDGEKLDRSIWSCALSPEPAEDETARLEERLLQRSLPLMEDARALRSYIRRLALSQAECARRLGRSQAAVANRLRLLRLPEDVAEAVSRQGLTERHARALLRLEEPELQRQVLARICLQRWTVAETEAHVDQLLSGRSPGPENYQPLLRELRQLRRTAPAVSFSLREEEDAVFFQIRLPKEKE